MVGCVIVSTDGVVVGWGFHARCGGAHAEVAALRAAGSRARGATAFVTLEPCSHFGRTPPCCDALARAGIARVVYGVSDPNPQAAGGAAKLREAGVEAVHIPCRQCHAVSAPFLCRLAQARPWIIAKWAQTIDGRTASRAGESRWISSPRSRAMVHRERARVDAVMVGIGTVLADDPHLLPRKIHSRRTPRRIIIDPRLATPIDAQVVRTAPQGPVEIWALGEEIAALDPARRSAFDSAGVSLSAIPPGQGEPSGSFRALPAGSLAPLMRELLARGVATVLCEGGAGLIGALLEEDLVDIAWSFTAGLAIADSAATPVAMGGGAITMIDSPRYRLLEVHNRCGDLCAIWMRSSR